MHLVMLAFSLPMYLFSVITFKIPYGSSSFKSRTYYPTYRLYHLPEKLQPYDTNAIFLYMWFYNILHTFIYHHLKQFIFSSNKSYYHTSKSTQKQFIIPKKYLFLLIYIFTNLSITTAVHFDTIPIHYLTCIPSFIMFYYMTQT